mgnify:FL=1
MRRTLKTLSPCLVAFLLMLTVAFADNAQELQKKLEGLKGISGIEKLESDHYAEKYLVRITQPVDHKNPAAGTFTQRVIVAHVGFDRPTILVTEGYGAAYALNPRYQEELSKLLDANMVFVEYRYFLESTPTPCNWEYLTAENSAYDLHNVNQTFRELYTGKWVSTGISKGGQTTCLYRAWFPDDVDFSVPYVAPLNRGVEDGRHEPFLRKVGTKKDRQKIEAFQIEILKHKDEIVPMLEKFCKDKKLEFRIPIAEVLDYCVLEYPFALWQWGTPTSVIPPLTSDAKTLFQYGMDAYHLYRGSEASMELPDIEIAQGCRKETLEEWATHAKLPVYVDTDITKLTFLKKDGDTAEIKKVWSDPISLPVKKGQTLGRVSYCMNGREIYSGKIKAEVSVKKWSPEKFFQIMWKEALLGK